MGLRGPLHIAAMRRPSVGWALLVGLLLGVHVNYAGCAALGAAAPVQAADHDHSHGAEVAAAAASASPDSELDAHAHRAAHDGAAHQDVAAAPSAEPHSTSEAAVAGTDAAHAHEDETAVSAEATAHDDHAHDEGGAHDDHANDEGGAHDDGHSHGVGILDFAAVAAELGSVDAARAEVCSQAALEDYDLGLHIGAIFILLGVSAAGALLPVALHISSKSSRVLACIKMGTFFGEPPRPRPAGSCLHPGAPIPCHLPTSSTRPPPPPGFGTILSTAFIHMLLPAAQNLSSPCLPASWNEAYEAWAYLFVVISITLMQLVDYLIEGAYQRYLERRGGQPHVEACHEQAHDHDKHTHHAAVVGAIVSLHGSHSPERERDHDSHASQASGPPEDVEAAHGDDGELAEDGGEAAGGRRTASECGKSRAPVSSALAEWVAHPRVWLPTHLCPPTPPPTPPLPPPTQARAPCTARAAPRSSSTGTTRLR